MAAVLASRLDRSNVSAYSRHLHITMLSVIAVRCVYFKAQESCWIAEGVDDAATDAVTDGPAAS